MNGSGTLPVWLRLISRFSSRQLVWVAAALFVLDLIVPDPIPLIDEVLLGLLTALLSRQRWRRGDGSPGQI